MGTLKKFSEVKRGERHAKERTWLPQKTEEVQPMCVINQLDWRIPLYSLSRQFHLTRLCMFSAEEPSLDFDSPGSTGSQSTPRSSRVTWVCAECGHSDGQWWGTCHSCHSVGTFKKFSEMKSGERHAEERSWLPQKTEEVHPMQLRDIDCGINKLGWRIPLFFIFDWGDPGFGKQSSHVDFTSELDHGCNDIAEGCDLGDPAPIVYLVKRSTLSVSIIPSRRKPLMRPLMIAHKIFWVAVAFMATAYVAEPHGPIFR
ncbi:hypothetical protein EZV62_003833 [Acer yangbiense]|uniref:LapB rubredoxin metal binding domain-containing protein n=1 Tax=Acer yangbiense TaxID=1000413 RepID=A0A5C7IIE5_9ROSI|nr:hypothetical protein EZV62_003828 [Acer yangbiense]TXG68898.1 hypothetical protein EZV62_003833 [Acer yangbiense]